MLEETLLRVLQTGQGGYRPKEWGIERVVGFGDLILFVEIIELTKFIGAHLMTAGEKIEGSLNKKFTFLSCIRIPITLINLPLDKVSLVSFLDKNSSYNALCRLERLHINTLSVFLGSCSSTSFFRRRSRNGRSILCNLSTR